MGNPLVAASQSSTTWYTGLGLLEDAIQVSSGIQNHSWVDATLGTVGGTLDALWVGFDPLGALLSWGASWLMEHVKPLKDALDWLAGNPDEIAAHARTWSNVAAATDAVREQYEKAVRSQTPQWLGGSGDSYRAYAQLHGSAMEAMSRLNGGIRYAVEGAGLVVGLVRGIVRSLIAQFVATLAVRLPVWLAEAGVTLGLATPVVVGQVTSLVATWVNKIRQFIQALLNSLRRLGELVAKLGQLLTEVRTLLRKLVRTDPMKADPARLLDPRRSPYDAPVGGGWGPWANRGEAKPGGAVGQTTNASCVSACGEMLTEGRVSQAKFHEDLGDWSNPGALADKLNKVDRPGWRGGGFGDEDTAVAAASRGPGALSVKEPGTKGEHMVVSEPLGDGTFRIRDPWNGGQTYVVGEDWIRQWVVGGVFR